MYLCSNCGKQSQRGEPLTKVVLQTRVKTYPFRERANRYCEAKRTWPDDPGGTGHEVVQEGQLCPRCVEDKERCPHGMFYTGAGACPQCEGTAAAAPAEGEVTLKGLPELVDGKVHFVP